MFQHNQEKAVNSRNSSFLTGFAVFLLVSLLFFQLIYSFLFPAFDPVQEGRFSEYVSSISIGGGDNFLLEKIYPFVSPEYRLNGDVLGYLASVGKFSPEYYNGKLGVSRPLYPNLVYLFSLPLNFFFKHYDATFLAAILVNFILISLTVIIFFWLLKKLFSLKVAWLSSILLIFSPYVHNSLNQPMAEMLMAFSAVLVFFLLYHYAQKPSVSRLIFFSLIAGILLLGKMFFAISFFVLLLAIYFRRYKEGVVFLIVHLIPIFFWYLWVTRVWQIPFHMEEIRHWEMGVWMLQILSSPWQETANVFIRALPYFLTSLLYGFLFIPPILAVIGFSRIPLKSKRAIYLGSIFSFFLLGFIINLYAYRHAFLLFPLIYPAAVLGVERIADSLKRFQPWFSPLFHVMAIGLMIFISSINFYQVFNFDYLLIVHWSTWPAPDFLQNIFKVLSGKY